MVAGEGGAEQAGCRGGEQQSFAVHMAKQRMTQMQLQNSRLRTRMWRTHCLTKSPYAQSQRLLLDIGTDLVEGYKVPGQYVQVCGVQCPCL